MIDTPAIEKLLGELEALMAQLPAPPYRWHGNGKNNDIYLATEGRGVEYLMGFERWGMRGGQPRFRHGRYMVEASKLLTFEVGANAVRGMEQARADDSVYRYDIRSIDNPVANLLVEALNAIPTLITTIRAMMEEKVTGGYLNGWQPIETAPKDGTCILAVIAGAHPQSGRPLIPEVVEWDESDECWWNCMWGYDNAHSYYRPTHWMPLPQPPAIRSKGDA